MAAGLNDPYYGGDSGALGEHSRSPPAITHPTNAPLIATILPKATTARCPMEPGRPIPSFHTCCVIGEPAPMYWSITAVSGIPGARRRLPLTMWDTSEQSQGSRPTQRSRTHSPAAVSPGPLYGFTKALADGR